MAHIQNADGRGILAEVRGAQAALAGLLEVGGKAQISLRNHRFDQSGLGAEVIARRGMADTRYLRDGSST